MSSKTMWIAVGLLLAGSPAIAQTSARAPQANWWSAPGREDGPSRIVWAAQKTPETPPTPDPAKPVLPGTSPDILKTHKNQKGWDQPVMLTRDFDGHYVSLAPGEKTKCMFYADDRAFGWIYSGQSQDHHRRPGAQGFCREAGPST